MNPGTYSCAIAVFALLAATAAGQPANLSPATQAAVDARRAELAKQAKAETDAAIARRNAGAMPERLRTTVGNIVENRMVAGAGTLTIPLTIFLEDIPPNAVIRGQRIIAAIDNLGEPLTVSANGPAGGPAVAGGRGRAGGAAPSAATGPTNTRSLQFQAPSRKAESIKLIEGEIDFVLSNDNSAVRVAGLAGFAGKKIENPALAKNEIEVTYLTPEMFDALKPTWGTSAAAAGAANFNSSAFFLVKDPKNRLMSLEIQDASGGTLSRGMSARNTNALGVSIAELPMSTPGAIPAQLHVLIAAPDAVKSYPFRLENIPLP